MQPYICPSCKPGATSSLKRQPKRVNWARGLVRAAAAYIPGLRWCELQDKAIVSISNYERAARFHFDLLSCVGIGGQRTYMQQTWVALQRLQPRRWISLGAGRLRIVSVLELNCFQCKGYFCLWHKGLSMLKGTTAIVITSYVLSPSGILLHDLTKELHKGPPKLWLSRLVWTIFDIVNINMVENCAIVFTTNQNIKGCV